MYAIPAIHIQAKACHIKSRMSQFPAIHTQAKKYVTSIEEWQSFSYAAAINLSLRASWRTYPPPPDWRHRTCQRDVGSLGSKGRCTTHSAGPCSVKTERACSQQIASLLSFIIPPVSVALKLCPAYTTSINTKEWNPPKWPGPFASLKCGQEGDHGHTVQKCCLLPEVWARLHSFLLSTKHRYLQHSLVMLTRLWCCQRLRTFDRKRLRPWGEGVSKQLGVLRPVNHCSYIRANGEKEGEDSGEDEEKEGGEKRRRQRRQAEGKKGGGNREDKKKKRKEKAGVGRELRRQEEEKEKEEGRTGKWRRQERRGRIKKKEGGNREDKKKKRKRKEGLREEEETEKENKWKHERRRKKAPRCTGSGSAPCPQHDCDGRTLKSGTRAVPVTPPLRAAVCSASAPANHTTENQHRSMRLRHHRKSAPLNASEAPQKISTAQCVWGTTENRHRSMRLRMGLKTKPRHDKRMKVQSK